MTGPAGPPFVPGSARSGGPSSYEGPSDRALQGGGDFRAEENMVRWSPQGQEDLLGGLRRIVSRLGSVSLRFYQSSCPGPTLRIRKGARSSVQRSFSGLCTETERGRSINWRDLRSVRLDLRTFRPRLKTGTAVAGFVDNQTAVVYLRVREVLDRRPSTKMSRHSSLGRGDRDCSAPSGHLVFLQD